MCATHGMCGISIFAFLSKITVVKVRLQAKNIKRYPNTKKLDFNDEN
jgi:hypothetical protein